MPDSLRLVYVEDDPALTTLFQAVTGPQTRTFSTLTDFVVATSAPSYPHIFIFDGYYPLDRTNDSTHWLAQALCEEPSFADYLIDIQPGFFPTYSSGLLATLFTRARFGRHAPIAIYSARAERVEKLQSFWPTTYRPDIILSKTAGLENLLAWVGAQDPCWPHAPKMTSQPLRLHQELHTSPHR